MIPLFHTEKNSTVDQMHLSKFLCGAAQENFISIYHYLQGRKQDRHVTIGR